MTRFPRVFLAALISVGGLLAPRAVHGAPDDGRGYVVEPGDYLFGIARRQGVTIGELLRANDLDVTDVIHPGQRLTIPGTGPAVTSTPGGASYTVRSGDYLFGIARTLGVPVRSLLAANGLTLTSVIHPGQRLTVPGAGPAANPTAGGASYTVRSGDSLYGIARRLGVPVRSLLAANGLTLTSVIHPGQRLEVPAGATSPAPAPASGTATPPAAPPSPSAPAPPRPPAAVGADFVERTIRDVWPDDLEDRALAIAWRESRFQPHAQNQCCSGLFQLYYDVHKSWLADVGIDSRGDLYDPRTNAEAAFALYQRAGGWSPWALPDG